MEELTKSIDDILDEIYDAIVDTAARYWSEETREAQSLCKRTGEGAKPPLDTYAAGVIDGLTGALTFIKHDLNYDEVLLTITLAAQSMLIQKKEDSRG